MSVVITVALVSHHHVITATPTLVQISRIADHVIITKRTWDIRSHVLMGLNPPVATVILLFVPPMLTLVLATNTERTSVFQTTVLGLGQMVTATLIVQFSRTVDLVITTERTWEIGARVLVVL